MRIRKRFHLLSSLTSDPQVNNQSSVVQVQQNGDSRLHCKKANTNKSDDLPNQPSDGQLMKKATWVSQAGDFLSSSKNLEDEEVNDEKRRVEEEDDEEEKKNSNNDIVIRKECTLNEEVNISSLAPFSSTFDQDGMWSGDGLLVPLKKRKRSFKINCKEEDDPYLSSEWKSKTNKKSSMLQDDENLQLLAKTTEIYVGDVIGSSCSSTSKKKKKKKKKKIRGSVILEGSRCSRMNGRGWRCCQPTLVGYSLCEHHLGKGRLRTMSSVTAPNQNQPMGSTSTIIIAPKDDDDDDDEQTQELRTPSWMPAGINQENLVVVNKTKRLGKMRARSMSSLLVAIDSATLAAAAAQQPPQKHCGGAGDG